MRVHTAITIKKDYGELNVPQVEHLFDSILQTYSKLKGLGFTYYQGKVTVIDMEDEQDA